MHAQKVIDELKKQYTFKKIVQNDKTNPTEIICEVEPASEHPEYSVAIAVIDSSNTHYHPKATETYTVLKGILTIVKDGIEHTLKEGRSLVIRPGEVHQAKGSETLVHVSSNPGWTREDHIVVIEK